MSDRVGRLDGARTTLGAKAPARAATTANITLSGYQTVDGIQFNSAAYQAGLNMRVLVKDQTDQTENGIYVAESGEWQRAADFDGNTDWTTGTLVPVSYGTTNGNTVWLVSSVDAVDVGENDVTFANITEGILDALAVVEETRLLTAGAGLTGGGDLSADRTFTVGAGTGITVNADDVALANTAVTPASYTNTSLTVDQQGRLTAASSGTQPHTVGKHTIYIPAAGMITATTSGAATASLESSTNDVNYKTFDFDATADEHVHFNIMMPKSWNESTITFRVVWSSTATDTDGVAWGLQAIALSDNEAIDTAWGTAVVVTDDAQSAAGEVYVTAESSAVTIGGTPAEGDIVFFRLFRDVSDANDDMTEDARLIGIQLFFTTNAATDA